MPTTRVADEPKEWTEDDARRLLAQWRQGGGSLAAFARERGMSAPRLYWWRRRLRSAEPAAAAAARTLVPAKVLPVSPAVIRVASEAGVAVSLHLPGGIELEISNASPTWVAAMATELARSS
jgi:transposase-like protein